MRTIVYFKFEDGDRRLVDKILECDRLLCPFLAQWPEGETQGIYASVLSRVTAGGP